MRSLDPESYVLKTGWGFEVVGDKVKHKYSHIGSLDKCKSYAEIPDRFKNKTVYISPKLDGLSAVAYYNNGKLVKGVTRGNGEYGKDITNKLQIILGNEIFDKHFTGAVRGELIINSNNWNLLQQKYTNLIAARNFAAGIINRKELDEDIQYIDMVMYKIVGQENKVLYNTRDEILKWLQLNFKHCIPNYYYPVLNEQSWNAYHEETFNTFKELGYGLDGLVLTDSDVLYNSQTSGYIYNECAFKFKAETDETIIKDIEWSLSRTQRMVPVAVVEPVELSGAIINRVTCNNAQMVQDMRLGSRAKIEIMRSNEVIPCIVNILEESNDNLPTKCPICGSDLVWKGVDLKCDNRDCANIKYSDLQQWCESIGETDGLQWTLMKQYLDNYNIHSIDDLYDTAKANYVITDLNSRKLSITETKIAEFFTNLYYGPIPVEKALIALNIPRLGEKTSKLLSYRQDVIYTMMILSIMPGFENERWLRQSLLELVKDATTQSIMENIHKCMSLRYLYSNDYSNTRIVFKDKPKDTEIIYVAVTGALNTMKRKDFESHINQYGYQLSSNLKKCKFLITNDTTSGSTKNKQAQEFGIPIVTELEFLDLLK